MRHGRLKMLAGTALIAAIGLKVFAHCQIPCGIYDDPARLARMKEHVTTIEKSMKEILALSGNKKPNWNQMTRWVNNKDEHADKLAEIVTYYFMAQRVKPVDPAEKEAYAEYIEKITSLHKIIVYSMKAKQTTDLRNIDKLRSLIKKVEALCVTEGGKI